MTDPEIITAVNAYLSNHLDGEYWRAKNETEKGQVIAMAKMEVCACVPFLDVERLEDPESASTRPGKADFFIAAIAEQALFLSRNYAERNQDRVVQSETVGPLSQTFAYLSSNGDLCSRANTFLKRLKRSIPRTLNWQRG